MLLIKKYFLGEITMYYEHGIKKLNVNVLIQLLEGDLNDAYLKEEKDRMFLSNKERFLYLCYGMVLDKNVAILIYT